MVVKVSKLALSFMTLWVQRSPTEGQYAEFKKWENSRDLFFEPLMILSDYIIIGGNLVIKPEGGEWHWFGKDGEYHALDYVEKNYSPVPWRPPTNLRTYHELMPQIKEYFLPKDGLLVSKNKLSFHKNEDLLKKLLSGSLTDDFRCKLGFVIPTNIFLKNYNKFINAIVSVGEQPRNHSFSKYYKIFARKRIKEGYVIFLYLGNMYGMLMYDESITHIIQEFFSQVKSNMDNKEHVFEMEKTFCEPETERKDKR